MKTNLDFIRTELDTWTSSPEIYPRWIEGDCWTRELVVLFAAHIVEILTNASDTMDTINLSIEDIKLLEQLGETQ